MRERLPRWARAIANSPEEAAAQIKAEIEKWAKVVADAKVKAEQ
jgi:hypothetical protein